LLEENETADATIFIEPPDPAVQSDRDSADEDEGGLANNLSGRQLRAQCEIVVPSTSRELRPRARNQRAVQSSSEESQNLKSLRRKLKILHLQQNERKHRKSQKKEHG